MFDFNQIVKSSLQLFECNFMMQIYDHSSNHFMKPQLTRVQML